MLIEVVVVYNAVNEFAGSDQKIEYTASCFYIPVIDFVISGETSKSDFIWQSFLKHHNKLNWKIYILRDTSQKIAKNPDKEAALEAIFPFILWDRGSKCRFTSGSEGSHLTSGTELTFEHLQYLLGRSLGSVSKLDSSPP